MSYLSEYESYRLETGVKIFLGSIPKTFSLTPKRFSEWKKGYAIVWQGKATFSAKKEGGKMG